jgi:hypothetical protein
MMILAFLFSLIFCLRCQCLSLVRIICRVSYLEIISIRSHFVMLSRMPGLFFYRNSKIIYYENEYDGCAGNW